MLLDRHRIARLIALSAMESASKGPERQLHEDEVQLFLKAAYDDATDSARAAFMERVEASPASEWPWSAVRSMAKGGGGGGGGGVGFGGLVLALPKLTFRPTPPALLLLRGQAESADADPGDRLPERGTAAGASWEALHVALDTWNTSAILPWIGPQGWIQPGSSPLHADMDIDPVDDDDAMSGPPADADEAPTEPKGQVPGRAPGREDQDDLPAPSAETETETETVGLNWRHPIVVAAGTALVVGVGAVIIVRASQGRNRRMISERLAAREGEVS